MNRSRATSVAALGLCLVSALLAALVSSESAPGAAKSSATAKPKVTTITVTAGKPSELAFKVSKLSKIPAGKLVFKVTNAGKIPHDFAICLVKRPSNLAPNTCSGKSMTTPMLAPGKSATLTVSLAKSGQYEFLCKVPGHAASGMKGLIGVGVAAATPARTTPTSTQTTTTTTTGGGGGSTTPKGDGCPAGQTIVSLGADDHDDDDSGAPSDGDGCV